MPKAVKEKKRLHAPAADFKLKEELPTDFDIHLQNLEKIKAELPLPEIKQEKIEEEEEEVNEAEKKAPEPKLTKEEKRKQRHDKLLQKLNYASVEIQKQKEKKEKETPEKKKKDEEEDTPLGLMTKGLLTTLLEAEEKEEKERQEKRGDSQKANFMSEKERQVLLKKEIKQFKSVTEHPVFKANPLATITEHLTNSIALQKAKDAKEPKPIKPATNNNNNNNTTNNATKKPKTQSQQMNEKRKSAKQQYPSKEKKSNLVSIQKSKKHKKK